MDRRKRYLSDLTGAQWAAIGPFLIDGRHQQRIRRKTVAFAALLASLAVMTTGCILVARVTVVAVARGVPTTSPFFREALGLGVDVLVGGALALGGGTKKGNKPGLYGGSRNNKICAKKKLIRFLKDPSNRRKAEEWADVQGIDVEEIQGFVKKLTPVVLRNDTLVINYDYKKGEADGFEALLEAGIAVLVDRYGKPVVKCSCGNPLGAFKDDPGNIDVEFKGKSKKWKAYEPKKVVKVEPVVDEEPLTTYELVDVDEENAGLERLAGTDGEQDKTLTVDPGIVYSEARVPAVTGMPAQEATQILEDQGFQVQVTDGPTDSADPGTVLEQDPAADEQVPQGATVTLTVAPGLEPSFDPGPGPEQEPEPGWEQEPGWEREPPLID